MTYELTMDDLRPDTTVRVALSAAGTIGRSYRLHIGQITPLPIAGLVRLRGHRITLTGRPIEAITIDIPPHDLRPDQMPLPAPQ